MARTHAEARSTRRATVPLVAIASSFFLPTYRACNDRGFERPLDYVDGAAELLWLVPVYAAAALLALLSLRALFRGEVGLRTRRLGLAIVAALALLGVGAAAFEVADGAGFKLLAAAPVVALLLAAAIVRGARGQSPWRIWEHLLLAYGVLAAAAVPTLMLSTLAFGSRTDLAYGAYVYLGSVAALPLLLLPAVLRGRS